MMMAGREARRTRTRWFHSEKNTAPAADAHSIHLLQDPRPFLVSFGSPPLTSELPFPIIGQLWLLCLFAAQLAMLLITMEGEPMMAASCVCAPRSGRGQCRREEGRAAQAARTSDG
jgi:hypothetical protein